MIVSTLLLTGNGHRHADGEADGHIGGGLWVAVLGTHLVHVCHNDTQLLLILLIHLTRRRTINMLSKTSF